MRRTAIITAVLVAFSSFVSSASAELVMTIDAASDTLYFTGSDSGTPGFGIQPEVVWTNSLPGNVGDVFIDNNTGLEPLITSSPNAVGQIQIGIVYSSGVDRTFFDLGVGLTDIGVFTTLSGNGPAISFDYSGFTTGQQTALESFVGTTAIVSVGSDFASLQIAAVPEPSSLALLGLCGPVLMSHRKRAHRHRVIKPAHPQ